MHNYTYDANNRVITGNVGGTQSTYQYDKLGNLTVEINGNTKIIYDYNELNQLMERRSGNKNANPNGYDVYTFGYDLRGNRTLENGPLGNKKSDEGYIYDATNHMVLGTNWKGETSAYTSLSDISLENFDYSFNPKPLVLTIGDLMRIKTQKDDNNTDIVTDIKQSEEDVRATFSF